MNYYFSSLKVLLTLNDMLNVFQVIELNDSSEKVSPPRREMPSPNRTPRRRRPQPRRPPRPRVVPRSVPRRRRPASVIPPRRRFNAISAMKLPEVIAVNANQKRLKLRPNQAKVIYTNAPGDLLLIHKWIRNR